MKALYNSMRTPGSTISHGIAFLLILIFGVPLLIRGYNSSILSFTTLIVFVASMSLLYLASTLYHWLDLGEKGNKSLKKFDHICISLLIAGSYTPICALVLPRLNGMMILSIIWGLAIVGIVIKVFWVFCPKWFSSILYIAMGWVCIFVIPQLLDSLSTVAFNCLIYGGIAYTIGGVIYGLKLPVFDRIHKDFGSHEIFHIFVMLGSTFHYFTMWNIA